MLYYHLTKLTQHVKQNIIAFQKNKCGHINYAIKNKWLGPGTLTVKEICSLVIFYTYILGGGWGYNFTMHLKCLVLCTLFIT